MEIKVETTKELYVKRLKSAFILSFGRILLISAGVAIIGPIIQKHDVLTLTLFLHDSILLFIICILMMYTFVFIKYFKQVKVSLKKLNEKSYYQVYTLKPEGVNILTETNAFFIHGFK